VTANRVTVSEDGMDMKITAPNGQTATLRSARPGGFEPNDVVKARTFALKSGLVAGQVDRARLYRVGRRSLLVQVNTGPPTWW
jgi:hypothetical protein